MKFFILFLCITFTLLALDSKRLSDAPLQKRSSLPSLSLKRSLALPTNTSYYPRSKSLTCEMNITHTDTYNAFRCSEHFRVIWGKTTDYPITTVENILSMAEHSYTVQVINSGFRAPRHSDTVWIDMFMSDTGAVNLNGDENLPGSGYAGIALEYSDTTPYFLLNKTMDTELLESTVSHEFFHTVQFASFDQSLMSDSNWEKNIWFLEASAVLQEKLTYPQNSNYTDFITDYITTAYKNMEVTDFSREYGLVVWAEWLYNRYGLALFRDVFTSLGTNPDQAVNTILDSLLPVYGTTREKEWALFAQDLTKYYTLPLVSTPEKWGIGSLYNHNTYYCALTDSFALLENNVTGESLCSLNKGGVIARFDGNITLNSLVADTNKTLTKGWNMLANPFTSNSLNLVSLFNDTYAVIWFYRNNSYSGFSTDTATQELFNNTSYATQEPLLHPGEAAWVYLNAPLTLSLPTGLLSLPLLPSSGWSFSPLSVFPQKPSKYGTRIIWHYDLTGWTLYSSLYPLSYNAILDILTPFEGYFSYEP